MSPLLAILLHISLRDDPSPPEEFRDRIGDTCMAQIQEMISTIRKSQVSRLNLILHLSVILVGKSGTDRHDMDGLSICIGKALDLTPGGPVHGQEASSIIPLLLDRLSQVQDTIEGNGKIRQESVIEETRTVFNKLRDRLDAHYKALDVTSTSETSPPATG